MAIQQGRLIPNDKLHEVLYETANAPPGNNAHKGALAHLTRASEELDRVQLARSHALAFDPTPPQNPAQAAQNQAFNANAKAPQPASTETAARLLQLDKPLVDADLYYRRDNRGALARLLAPLLPTASNTAAVDDREREVDRECVCRRGQRLAHAPRPDQSAGASAGLAADGNGSRAAAAEGRRCRPARLQQADEAGVLAELAKATPDHNARIFTFGERSYSVNELRQIHSAGQAELSARVAEAGRVKGGSVSPQA